MDKNLLLAVTLSIAVYAFWFGFIEKRVRPAPAPAAQSHAAAPAATVAPQPSAPPPATAARSRDEIVKESSPINFGNSEVRVSPKGAAVVSWRDPEPLGKVELVAVAQPGFFSTWPDLVFRQDFARPFVFTAERADGLRIAKEFVPGTDRVLPRLRITLSNPTSMPLDGGAWTLSVGPGLGTIQSEEKENAQVWRALGLLHGGQGLEGKIEAFKPGEHAGAFRWVGIDNRYFLCALLPDPADFGPVASQTPPGVTLTAKNAVIAAHGTRAWDIPFYLGPKGNTWLSRYGLGLERSIDFGFFAQLGRLILKALNHIHKVTGNWGWSIILLTIALQVLLFPLTYKSLKAAAAMKRLQPEIARLQQKYNKEPMKLNAEMMELYKKHGANPLGGCLPMLLQAPVFIALFNALRNAWELHGAPWMFWIRDLSVKDPFYVLPVVMGGLMFLQNKMNPASADPTQAKMMTWMPVIFTFMFMNFPSGLVLYWLTNSLLSALQQMALKNHFSQAAVRR